MVVDSPVGYVEEDTEPMVLGVDSGEDVVEAVVGKEPDMIVLEVLSFAPFPNPLTGRQVPKIVLTSDIMGTV